MLDPADVATRTAPVFASGPKLRLAVLFGSVARGEARPGSDVDIAVLPANPGFTIDDELRLQVGLERALLRTVDVVRLDRAPTMLAYRIARDGVPIAAESVALWRRFQARAAIAHDELAPLLHASAARYRRFVMGASTRA